MTLITTQFLLQRLHLIVRNVQVKLSKKRDVFCHVVSDTFHQLEMHHVKSVLLEWVLMGKVHKHLVDVIPVILTLVYKVVSLINNTPTKKKNHIYIYIYKYKKTSYLQNTQ